MTYCYILRVSFSMFWLSGVQQNATCRIISPGEKPLQQAEPVNSHHKAKKLRLDDCLSGGFHLNTHHIMNWWFYYTKHLSLIDAGWFSRARLSESSIVPSLSIWSFPNLLFFNFLPLSSPLSGFARWGGERGHVSLRPEESRSEEIPWCWWAEGSRCCLPACVSHYWAPPAPLPPPCFFILLLPKSVCLCVKEPYIILDICLCLYHYSV